MLVCFSMCMYVYMYVHECVLVYERCYKKQYTRAYKLDFPVKTSHFSILTREFFLNFYFFFAFFLFFSLFLLFFLFCSFYSRLILSISKSYTYRSFQNTESFVIIISMQICTCLLHIFFFVN